MSVFRIVNNNILLNIKAVPGASRSEIIGIQEDRLRIKVAATPENGKANTELCTFLAKQLNCPKKDVVLISGEKSRLKTLAIPLELKESLEKMLKNC
jgi:uncharacterized protein (TIGR00251 family)